MGWRWVQKRLQREAADTQLRALLQSLLSGRNTDSSPRDRQKQQTHFCPEGLSPGLVPRHAVPGRKHDIPETPGKPLSLPEPCFPRSCKEVLDRETFGAFQPQSLTCRVDLQSFPGDAPWVTTSTPEFTSPKKCQNSAPSSSCENHSCPRSVAWPCPTLHLHGLQHASLPCPSQGNHSPRKPVNKKTCTNLKLSLKRKRNSLAVQGLGLGTFTAGAHVQSLFRELRSTSHVALQIKKKKKRMKARQNLK